VTRFFFFFAGFVVAACGARTALLAGTTGDGATGGTAGDSGGPPSAGLDASAPCDRPPWILFDRYGGAVEPGIYAIHPDGSGLAALIVGSARDPSISPDGASLLYVMSVGDEDSLVLRDTASGKTRTIAHLTVTPPSAGLGKGAVSPDNALIVYGNTTNLNVVAFDGSHDRVLVPGPYEAGCCSWGYGHPLFSAGASTIYFSTIGRLESIHPDGSGRTLLEQDQFFSNRSIEGFVFPNVSLSPDGTALVAQVACDVAELRVYALSSLPGDACTAGRRLVETHLSGASNEAANPAWGTDGLIAYEDGNDVFVIPSTGGTPKNVTANITAGGSVAADPIWASGCAPLP
jgi:hypothetical protein